MYPTRHVLLRDRERWEALASGLVADADGTLSLAATPSLAPDEMVDAAGPFEVEASGVAAAACCSVFIVDGELSRLVYRDGLCHDEAVLPRPGADCGAPLFAAPRAVAVNRKYVAVADSSLARVLMFRAHDLSLARLHKFSEPWGVALDADSRVVVLDRGAQRVFRLSERGETDGPFCARLALALQDPVALAMNQAGELFVSDAAVDQVLRFAPDGSERGTLIAPATGWKPRALAADGTRVYVADAASGSIWIYEGDGAIGVLRGYRGPVAGLSALDGALYIKPAAPADLLTACTDTGVIAQGDLIAGPLDAGDRDGWERVNIEAFVPEGARVELAVYFDSTTLPPAANEWLTAPAHDLLLANIDTPPVYPGRVPDRRYLWIRVRLQSRDGSATPQLRQVHAATADENYLTHLPAVHAEQDTTTSLERLLALSRSEIGGGEALLRGLPQLATPAFAPTSVLPWLAGWLSFELPAGIAPDAQRQVLLRAADLYRRRGTVGGLIEFIHIYTGVRAHVVEWARERRVWQLGVTSALGFDTGLPAGAVDGIVVADPEILRKTDPAWGCDESTRVVVGHAVVGADRPLAPEDFGSVLFDDHANRITVLIPAGQAQDAAMRDRIREVIAAEVPAHVIFDVCFIEPRLRIGMQSRIGVDAVIAGAGTPLQLSEAHLGEDSRLGGRASHGVGADPGFYVGQQSRIGSALALG